MTSPAAAFRIIAAVLSCVALVTLSVFPAWCALALLAAALLGEFPRILAAALTRIPGGTR